MIESIATLFQGYGFIPMIIFAVGIIFLTIEVFIPGFGVFGILGLIFITIGIVVRFFIDFDLQHVVVMIVIVLLFVMLLASILFYTAKSGLLGKSALVENRTSVTRSSSINNEEYVELIGKKTVAETRFLPAGKFSYEGQTYEAFSYGEFIEKGTDIHIVEVIGNTIYVRKSEFVEKDMKGI